MARSDNRPGQLVRDYYLRMLRGIMRDYNIDPSNLDGVVPSNSFVEAIQHTNKFLLDPYSNRLSHHMYRRYMKALRKCVKLDDNIRRIAHIDIGCGAGLFSWVFLDWALENGYGYDFVDLYGYDNSQAMVGLATEFRYRLTRAMSGYPNIHYDDDIDNFMWRLKMAWRPNTHYIISFGHILGKSYKERRSTIIGFAHIVDAIMRIKNLRPQCIVVAVDAKELIHDFTDGWNLLLTYLANRYTVRHTSTHPKTSMYALINDSNYTETPDYSYMDTNREFYNDEIFPDWRSDIPWDDEELPWESKLPR